MKKIVSVLFAILIVILFYKILLNKKTIILNKNFEKNVKINNKCFTVDKNSNNVINKN